MLMGRCLFLSFAICSAIACECGPDVRLGSVDLADASLAFVPYREGDVLTFLDQDSVLHRVTLDGAVSREPSIATVSTLCSEGMFDNQNEVFDTELIEVGFRDPNGTLVFYLTLSTSAVFESNPPILYDVLGVFSSFAPGVTIVTAAQRGVIPDEEREALSESRLIGDTVLFGRPFREVYVSTIFEGSGAYYSPVDGLVAYTTSDSTYGVLVAR